MKLMVSAQEFIKERKGFHRCRNFANELQGIHLIDKGPGHRHIELRSVGSRKNKNKNLCPGHLKKEKIKRTMFVL